MSYRDDVIDWMVEALEAVSRWIDRRRSDPGARIEVIPDPPRPPVSVQETTPEEVREVISDPEEPELLLWDTPKHAWHAVRVMCDRSGLSFAQKYILCACVYQESEFWNVLPDGRPVMNDNGTSKDWGIVQVNDWWWIGTGKLYPSVQYVIEHPAECVQWMIDYYKANGHLKRWSSYSTGAYKKWLPLTSKMWQLAEK